MIDRSEIENTAAQFGTPESQVVRDHLISHVLAAIGELPDQHQVTFFGGTALCRTWLPDLRLSEDIDLLVDPDSDLEGLRKHILRKVRNEYPTLKWTRLGNQNEVETWTLATAGLVLKVQFVHWRQGWKSIPLVRTDVQLRYADLDVTTQLQVPTTSGFSAMKLMAWLDRHTPRDLYDLAALADAGYIDEEAVLLVKDIADFTPRPAVIERKVPRSVETAWQNELGHQIAITSTAEHCLERVRLALANLDA